MFGSLKETNKYPAIRPLRILVVHRGPYRSGEECVKRDLCAIIVQGDDLPTRVVEVGTLGLRYEAACREGSLGVVLWLVPFSIDLHHNDSQMVRRSVR